MEEPLKPPGGHAAAPLRVSVLHCASGHLWGRATLDAPASLNALSRPMVDALDAQLALWADDARVVGVLIDAAGDRAFCAGGDIVDLIRDIRATPPGQEPAAAIDFFTREYRLDHRIHVYPKPVVAWGHGIVMGGGVGLLAGASHRVVTPQTRFAMPEVAIGLFPDVGGSWLLPRMPGGSGLFLALTGTSVNAADALYAGLADFCVAHEQHAVLLDGLMASAFSGDAAADGAALSHLLERLGRLGSGVQLPASPLREHRERIDAVIGHDRLQDLAPRLAALRDDPDPWLQQAAAGFAKGSPTSIALGFELQRRARHLSLADVFRLEWQAARGCCMHHDFAEGVRALLIDKDKAPRWQPATLDEVTPELIAAHLDLGREVAHPLADLRDSR